MCIPQEVFKLFPVPFFLPIPSCFILQYQIKIGREFFYNCFSKRPVSFKVPSNRMWMLLESFIYHIVCTCMCMWNTGGWETKKACSMAHYRDQWTTLVVGSFYLLWLSGTELRSSTLYDKPFTPVYLTGPEIHFLSFVHRHHYLYHN